jgi:hypothetical protein
VQVARSYYASSAAPGTVVTVRLYDHDVEIIDAAGVLLRRHPRSTQPGHFEMLDSDRIFNPSSRDASHHGESREARTP